MKIEHGNAICYSGYREGQSPQTGRYPSKDQIREDLLILAPHWSYLRLYDCSLHAQRVLEIIREGQLPFRVMLGMDVAAEISNPNCPWGANFSDDVLAANKVANLDELRRLIALATEFADSVFSVSIGNEAGVEWSDHRVPVDTLIEYVRRVRPEIDQPITFCDNYVPWLDTLVPLANELDFISVHTYPAWEYRTIDDALDYTEENYGAVADRYPDKTVVITEAGWTTRANGRGIEPNNASEQIQATYYRQLTEWAAAKKVLTFVFEAFDEPWKGSADPMEPEKHWGLFTVDRAPKMAMQELYRDRV